MALVSDGPETTNVTDILERAEIEVWDNNVIVQLAIPQSLKKCKTYRVGATTESMTEHPLPQLKEFRMKKNQLQVSTNLSLCPALLSKPHAVLKSPSGVALILIVLRLLILFVHKICLTSWGALKVPFGLAGPFISSETSLKFACH